MVRNLRKDSNPLCISCLCIAQTSRKFLGRTYVRGMWFLLKKNLHLLTFDRLFVTELKKHEAILKGDFNSQQLILALFEWFWLLQKDQKNFVK